MAFFFAQSVGGGLQIPRSSLLLELPSLLGANFAPAENAGWRYLPQRFDLLLCAAVILSAAWGLGRVILALLRISLPFRSAEGVALSLGLGLSAWSLLTLAMGLSGALERWLFVACAITAVGGGVVSVVRQRNRDEVLQDESARGVPPAVLLICAPFVLAMLLGSMLPSTDFDVKEYHLQGPKEFYLGGRVQLLPHNVYTSFPFLTEMLSLSAMMLRGDWWRGALAGKSPR